MKSQDRRPAGGAAFLGALGLALLAAGVPTSGPLASEVAVAPSGAPAAQAPAMVHSDGPPAGHTGGFDEPTCLDCHKGFPLNVDGTLEIAGLPESYEGGETYLVTVVLRSTEMKKAGFQAAVRFTSGDQKGRQAGTLRAVDDRTAVVESAGTPPLQYVQQREVGTDVVDERLAEWTFEWTAPARSGQGVALDAAANSANGDTSPLGDLIYTATLELRGSSAGNGS